MIKRILGWLLFALLLFGAAFGGAYFFQEQRNRQQDGAVKTLAAASLAGLREQAKLSPFAASFVAVVTSQQQRFGLTAERTMIMPGLVRYDIDLAKLEKKDLAWDEQRRTLTVTLPPLIVNPPQVALDQVKEYGPKGILTALTDAAQSLDATNRARAQAELLRQAKGDVPMRLARDAGRRVMERSFAMPLEAAGLKARVVARFADEQE